MEIYLKIIEIKLFHKVNILKALKEII